MKLDKEKIKRYSKIAQYCVIALCWLMALVGISAYAVYWCRANVNYETSQNKQTLDKPKYNLATNSVDYKFYSPKTLSFLQTDFSIPNNTQRVNTYLDVNAQGQDWSNTSVYSAVYSGEFYFLQMGTTTQFRNISFNFSYDASNESVSLVSMYLDDGGSNIRLIYRSSDSYYNSVTILLYDYTYYHNNSNLKERYHGSILDFFCEKVFDLSSDYSTQFVFKDDYNFNALVSENITGDSNLIVPYKLSFNGDPTDEMIYAFVRCDFVSNNYIYKGIYLEFRKPYIVRYNGQDNQVNFYGSTSQLLVNRVFYLRDLPSSLSTYPSASTMDLVCTRHTYGQKEISIGEGQSNINAIIYGTDYIWSNDAYRLVYIENTDYNSYYDVVTMPLLNSVDNLLYNPYLYRGLELYQVLNNGYLTYDLGTLTYQVGDTHLGDVFTLYTQAFTGLMPILNIQILPSFTLGMLLFIPLVITIIIVILRLVKK